MPDHNEHTSPSISSLSAKLLTMTDEEILAHSIEHPETIRSLAASALTQAKDRDES